MQKAGDIRYTFPVEGYDSARICVDMREINESAQKNNKLYIIRIKYIL